VINELEKADPSSIVADGEWLVEVECDVTDALGEVADYFQESSQADPPNPSISNEEESSSENSTVISGNSRSSGLKGVKIPVFDGSPEKWPYFWSILAKAQAGKCSLCDGTEKHKEGDCPVFLAGDANQRWALFNSKKVSSKCGVNSCEKGHHKLLHVLPKSPKGVHCGKAQVSSSGSGRVALKTVIVPFVKDSGGLVLGTVLLDSGSETTLIRSGFAKQLGVQGQRLTVDTVGGVRTTLKSQRVRVPFAPAVTDVDVYAWTIKNICEPVQSVDWTEIKKQYEHLRDVPVMSVGETAVDVLLGLDAASLMVPLEVRPGKHGQPCAELTPLGWVISGPVPTTTKPMQRILCVHVVDDEEDANHQLRKLWEIDSFGVRVEATTSYTRSEQRAVDIMNETCRRVESGYENNDYGHITP
jgi:hypothetical protein